MGSQRVGRDWASMHAFTRMRNFPSILSLLSIYVMKGCQILLNVFPVSTDRHHVFFLFKLLIWFIDFHAEPTLHSWDGIPQCWSWYTTMVLGLVWFIVLFKFSISLMICLVCPSIIGSWVLHYPTITAELYISTFNYLRFCFIYFGTLLFSYIFVTAIYSQWIEPFTIPRCSFVSSQIKYWSLFV